MTEPTAAAALVRVTDAAASVLEQAATMLEGDTPTGEVASFLRLAAHVTRAEGRAPMLAPEVRHAAARLRHDDPRTVFPELGRDLAGGAG